MQSVTFDSITMGWQGAGAPSAASSLAAPEAWFVNWSTGTPFGEPGPAVNEFTAFNYLAVYDCVSLIASKIAELPLVTYRSANKGRSRTPATDRSEYPLLLTEFNPDSSAMIAREAGIAHLLTWGNSYTQIVRNKSGSRVLQLRVLGPDVVRPVRGKDAAVVYEVYRRGTGERLATLAPDEVLHVPGLSFDGLLGYAPIRVAKTAIRAGMAQDREAEKFVTRGIRPPGGIKFPQGRRFKDEQDAIQFRDTFRRIHSTEDSAVNVIILEDGAEWVELGVDPKSAQLLDSRKYSKKEICGMYRVPPFLVGDVDSSTSWGTGIGEQKQGFVDYCLMGWVRRVECELKRKLGRDDPDVYYRHQVEELLRGDLLKRTQAREIQHRRGIITDNEWRLDEHLDAVEGGDVRHFPLNEGRVSEEGDEMPPPAPQKPGGPPPRPMPPPADPDRESEDREAASRARLAGYLRRTLLHAAGRCLRKEAEQARRAASDPAGFVAWVESFYSRHAEMVEETTGPPAAAWAEAFGGPADYPARHLARSRAELLAAADGPPASFPERVARLAERWQAERLADVAAAFTPGGGPCP